jgi:hypothetical protein
MVLGLLAGSTMVSGIRSEHRIALNSASRTWCGMDLSSDQRYKTRARPKATVPRWGTHALSEAGMNAAGVTFEEKYYLWYI